MMTPTVEFGYFGETGSQQARGYDYAPALRRALDIVRPAFKSLWFADHFMYEDAEIHESWVALSHAAALAPGLTVGHMVSCNSYRPPTLVAKMGASLQAFTQGRFVLGYGAGWKEDEYRAYGYDYPSAPVRIAMMEEAIQLIRTMWRDKPATFHGKYYQVEEAYCEPRPDPLPPIMIGGDGEKYTLRAVARHADWWNCYSRTPADARRKLDVLREHCAAEGRDFASIRKTWSGPVLIARDHQDALRMAGDRIHGEQPPIVGSPAAVAERIHELAALGFDLFQVSFDQFPDTAPIELFIAEVMPQFKS